MSLKKKLIKHTNSKSRIGKAAKKVSNFAGGKGITDYIAGKGSKKGALKSAGMVALTVGTGAAGLGRKAIVKGAGKAAVKRKAIKKSVAARKRELGETAIAKRLRLNEETARRMAKKRATTKNTRTRKINTSTKRGGKHDIRRKK